MVPTLDSSTQADTGCSPLESSGFKQTQHLHYLLLTENFGHFRVSPSDFTELR